METLRSVAKSRAGRWLAVVVALVLAFCVSVPSVRARLWIREGQKLIAASNALDHRVVEGRLSEEFQHRPFRPSPGSAEDFRQTPAMRSAASELLQQWRSTRAPQTGRRAGAGLLLAGRADDSEVVLGEVLERETGEADLLASIRRCDDAALLIDFSAVALQRARGRQDARELLVAFEAADRAWQLTYAATAAWNRGLTLERLGLPRLAVEAWRNAATLETSPLWAREAKERGNAAARTAGAAPEISAEVFFHRELIERSAVSLADAHVSSNDENRRIEIVSGDQLASDTAASLRQLSPSDKRRALTALAAYARGRIAFENDRLEEARQAFASAEAELGALRIPLALLARDQRIRSECSQSHPNCLQSIRAFRADLGATKRYPWLEARADYAEGQTFYRRGRIYDAAEWFERARAEFHRLNDSASVGVMDTLLANVFTTAGETDLALAHYLDAIAIRSPQMGDRRRRQIEDVVSFMVRHGYLSTAEALLDELAVSPATDSARVVESMLRGILYARRDQRDRSALNFERAHALLDKVSDKALRSEMQMLVAIGEAGSRVDSPHPILEQIDSAIAQHQGVDQAVWMPQLLAERGAALERKDDQAGAEHDYLRAIEILEAREPNIDQMLIGFGVASDSESSFDRAIRMMLRQGRITDALLIAQRATALRISALYAPAVGLRDVFRAAREPVKGDSVASLRRALQSEQIAVVYHLLRDELITWVITEREVFVVRRRAGVRDVIRRVDEFRECASRRGCNDEEKTEAVSNLLLRDWIEQVPREATLLIQPPAELQGVPFSMLRTHGGERLLLRNPTTTAPSLRAFVHTAKVDAERAAATGTFFAAAAQPGGNLAPLPLAVDEVRRASRFYPQPVVDTQARRAAFIERSPSYSIVHFAGHVIVNEQQPLLSALVFNQGDRLYVHELGRQLFAHARMVVLSGCETGRSPHPTMSVAHALLSQNVPSVVYTLWPVSDDAGEAFATAFHREISAGATRAGAVRAAQLALLREHPQRADAWAAFALAGIPGAVIGNGDVAGPLIGKEKHHDRSTLFIARHLRRPRGCVPGLPRENVPERSSRWRHAVCDAETE